MGPTLNQPRRAGIRSSLRLPSPPGVPLLPTPLGLSARRGMGGPPALPAGLSPGQRLRTVSPCVVQGALSPGRWHECSLVSSRAPCLQTGLTLNHVQGDLHHIAFRGSCAPQPPRPSRTWQLLVSHHCLSAPGALNTISSCLERTCSFLPQDLCSCSLLCCLLSPASCTPTFCQVASCCSFRRQLRPHFFQEGG